MNQRAFLLLFLATAAVAQEGWVTHNVTLSPDGKTIVRGRMHAERGTARLRIEDAASGGVLHELRVTGPVRDLAFHPNGKRFAATNDHGPLQVYDTATGRVVRELAGHRRWVLGIAMAAERVASIARDETVRVWSLTRGVELWRRDAVSYSAVALSPDGSIVAVADGNGRIDLARAEDGRELRPLSTGQPGWIFRLAFSPDGKHLVAGSKHACVFDIASGKLLAKLDDGAARRPTAVTFSTDGAQVAVAGADQVVRVWRWREKKLEYERPATGGVGAIAFTKEALHGAKYYGACHSWNHATGNDRPFPWTKHEAGTRGMLLDLAFFDQATGIAVGGIGEGGPSVIVRTTDAGATWSPCRAPSKGRLYDVVAIDDTTAFAVGYGGVVLTTTDRGTTWRRLPTPAPAWLAGVEFLDESTGFVVGGDTTGAVIWKTTNAGKTWTSLREGIPAAVRERSLRSVHFTRAHRGFAVGAGGVLLETTNGGQNWVTRPTGTEAWLRSIHVNGSMLHVAGKGVLLRSMDDAKTWTRLKLPRPHKLNRAVFSSKHVGWLTEFDGNVLATQDGGRSWHSTYKHDDVTIALHVGHHWIYVATGNGTVLRRRR